MTRERFSDVEMESIMSEESEKEAVEGMGSMEVTSGEILAHYH